LSFWGPFVKKHIFHKKEFSNEIFCNLLFITFAIAPICHMFFVNHFWETMNFFKCIDFLPNFAFHLKTLSQFQITPKDFDILSFGFLYYKLYNFVLKSIYIVPHFHVVKDSWTLNRLWIFENTTFLKILKIVLWKLMLLKLLNILCSNQNSKLEHNYSI